MTCYTILAATLLTKTRGCKNQVGVVSVTRESRPGTSDIPKENTVISYFDGLERSCILGPSNISTRDKAHVQRSACQILCTREIVILFSK